MRDEQYFNHEAVFHLEDEILFSEWVQECLESQRMQWKSKDALRMQTSDEGREISDVLSEDAFIRMMELAGDISRG
ncbi:hypothetical protein [Alicyclobacillus ferrooxydans]|uniref:Uncharacterized protein n=1 Tax=Alicyclobacillus ferrooxydans TaxID=471514 RepID=A0A0P9CM26_9BACL|nr:hypothetical protein [Alicyclobacillus ferrooxydans]KPV44032.1 hypothetical protein AN477_08980 [Alicyclobacillus ferrooxydans]